MLQGGLNSGRAVATMNKGASQISADQVAPFLGVELRRDTGRI
jgi:hypothetical protein